MFKCEYCSREFARESTVNAHVCEQKKRHDQQNERGVQLGYHGFLEFYRKSQGSAQNKTYDSFATSPYYRAFVKWGWYCVNTRVINPEGYLHWLLEHNKKIDVWAKDKQYSEYLETYVYQENATVALTRALELAVDWHEDTGYPDRDYLRHANRNGLCYKVASGRLSAWVLYNCASGIEFLEDLTVEQIQMVWPYIDSDRWQQTFGKYSTDQEYVKQLLKEAGW